MAAPSKAQRLEKQAGAMLTAVEIRIDVFKRIMEGVSRKMRAVILEALMNPTSPIARTQAADMLYVQSELAAQLARAGYRDLSTKFVNSFSAVEQGAAQAAMIAGAARIAPLDEAVLIHLKQTSLAWLDEIGRRAVAEVAKGLIENTLLGGTKRQMIDRIGSELTKFQSHAATYAETAIVTYDREVQWQTFRNAGVTRLIYTGPKDIKNRPFCQTHIGKSYTRDEIAKLDNGTKLMPVSRFGGGWNCRHIWMPDPTEDLK